MRDCVCSDSFTKTYVSTYRIFAADAQPSDNLCLKRQSKLTNITRGNSENYAMKQQRARFLSHETVNLSCKVFKFRIPSALV